MTTVTGLTAERMIAIEDASVVDGEIVAGNLILSRFDGSQINAGSVAGPQGPEGDPGPGVPVGGATGQLLAKNSGTNYDTEWVDPTVSSWQTISEGSIPDNVSTFTISSIPQIYKDLRLLLKIGTVFGTYFDNLNMRLGGDTSNNYRTQRLRGFNNVVSHAVEAIGAQFATIAYVPGNSGGADAFGAVEVIIPRYRDADYRALIARWSAITSLNGADQYDIGNSGGIWQNAVADAVTSWTIISGGGSNFKTGTKYLLEGRF